VTWFFERAVSGASEAVLWWYVREIL